MNEIYEKPVTIRMSQCDFSGRLGPSQALDLCMDLAGEHAAVLGNGVPAMRDRGLFWVAVKTLLRFGRMPGIGETVTLRTWPETPGRMRCDRDYLLLAGDEVLLEGRTEWTVLDAATGGLHAMRDGVYAPDQTYSAARALDGPFHRFTGAFEGEPFARYTVKSTDVDLAGHMNNVAYLRMLLSLQSIAARAAHPLREVELHYRSACYEGNELLLRRRAADGAEELQAARADGEVILLARAVFD